MIRLNKIFPGKADYNEIAKYYDEVIGKGFETNEYIRRKIFNYNRNVKSILELGCGTGNNLLTFKKEFSVTGIDISEEMLKIAKKKIPNGDFYLQDIRSFRSDKKFDLIICLFDTLNHLLLFTEWKRLFADVSSHLNKQGLFIFDINTLTKLQNISDISPFVHKFDSSYLIVNVKKIFKNTFNWNLKIFENKKKNLFILKEIDIKESSFEIEKIKSELSKLFDIKRIEDENEKKINKHTDRIFFVCQKRA